LTPRHYAAFAISRRYATPPEIFARFRCRQPPLANATIRPFSPAAFTMPMPQWAFATTFDRHWLPHTIFFDAGHFGFRYRQLSDEARLPPSPSFSPSIAAASIPIAFFIDAAIFGYFPSIRAPLFAFIEALLSYSPEAA
jgi:hypothetical protein